MTDSELATLLEVVSLILADSPEDYDLLRYLPVATKTELWPKLDESSRRALTLLGQNSVVKQQSAVTEIDGIKVLDRVSFTRLPYYQGVECVVRGFEPGSPFPIRVESVSGDLFAGCEVSEVVKLKRVPRNAAIKSY